MKKANVAIMGLGTVGGGTYDILTQNRKHIADCYGIDITVKTILDRDPSILIKRNIDTKLFTSSIDDLAADKSISVVVETMGGIEPARTFILKALRAGKSVVTANKELIAKHWSELESAAREGKCGLYFEASCVGGVPIIRTLTESMQGDNIVEIYGIINGTTNYILSSMAKFGTSYEDALKKAQQLGFAEFDPTSDVEGFDAAYKLSILSSLAFHTSIPYGRIYREGITKITCEDIKYAAEFGYDIKLLAIGRRNGNDVEVRVHPAFVPSDSPLAAVNGAMNAVYLKGDHVGDIMLYGAGAGAHPTGSAIVSDIVKAISAERPVYCDFVNNGKLADSIKLVSDFNTSYYISVTAEDKTGVLGRIAMVMGENGVSIKAAIQKASDDNAHVVFLTHSASEQAVLKSLRQINDLSTVVSIDSMIRVL